MAKLHKTMQMVKKQGLTSADLLRMRQIAEKRAKEMEQEAVEKAFLYMLAIPLNVLVNDYWKDEAKDLAPLFIDDVISLFDSVEKGFVREKELADFLFEYTGMKIEADWLSNERE